MSDLIECIPNISEGRDTEILDALSRTITNVSGVKLLHRDVGYDANRTVFTFAGPSNAVIVAAYELVKKASQLIDMEKHQGNHPRIGAVDVCPFVAIRGIDPKELIDKVNGLGRHLSNDLDIPIFLYEQSARAKERQLLADIRKGEYEGLAKKLQLEEWLPDFGSRKFNPKFGGMVMGVRNFLIAYNVNVHGGNLQHVRDIAAQIRENGNFILNKNHPSRLKGVRAIGWKVKKYNCQQVSTNITDFETTGIHEVYETIKTLAKDLGLTVQGSELIGLIPQKALLNAGHFYTEQNNSTDLEVLELAVKALGLAEFSPFLIDNRILEYLFNQ